MKWLFCIICSLVNALAGGAATNPAWQTFPQPGSFIMSLARDGMGNVGTKATSPRPSPPPVAERGNGNSSPPKMAWGMTMLIPWRWISWGASGWVISITASRSITAHAGKTMTCLLAPSASGFSRLPSVPWTGMCGSARARG